MFNLSFIIATKNRLPYLEILFELFFKDLLPDEEIVVIDADSTDGSKEFLESMFRQGRIHQYISEADENQAEGWNKAMLLARGILLKKITDDDVFSMADIRTCKKYMLAHQATDICIANSLHSGFTNPEKVVAASRFKYYQDWKDGKVPCFTFSDADMMIRKSTLSLTGLYDAQFVMLDWEFSLRCSFLKTTIAYYTGILCLSVATPGNVSSVVSDEVKKREAQMGKAKYGYPGDNYDVSAYSWFKIFIGKTLKRFFGYKSGKGSLPEVSFPEGNKPDLLPLLYANWYENINNRARVEGEFK